MNKTRMACAALYAGLACQAHAQSSVTLYGLIDAGVRVDRTSAGTTTGIATGSESGNRWGLRGQEDLGGGLAAVYTLEAGFLADTGAAISNGASGPGFGRQSSIALASNQFGSVGLGRQYNPIFSFVAGRLDPFNFGFIGSIGNSVGLFAGAPARSSNSITYSSPVLYGFKGDLLYALGESSKPGVTKTAGDARGASLYYFDDRMTLGYSYHQSRGTTDVSALPRQTRHVFGGNYDFKVAKIFASYASNKNTVTDATRIDRRAYSVGASVPLGGGAVLVQYQGNNDETSAKADVRQFALGYNYFLSKRTDIYVVGAKMRNRNGATSSIADSTNNSLGTVNPGSAPSSFQVGIRHKF